MIRFIPPFILEKYEQQVYSGALEAFVLFFDVADFTFIGTETQKHGKQGAEELSKLLDYVFSEPIGIVNSYGGFVSLFAGDAFCAIFPAAQGASILAAVKAIRACFPDNMYHTTWGDFALKVRQTVSYGKISWHIYEDKRQNEYVFSGIPMQELADLSIHKTEFTFSQTAVSRIGAEYFEMSNEGAYILSAAGEACRQTDLPGMPHPALPSAGEFSYTAATKSRFIHPKYSSECPQNEIRSAAYCFASLQRVATQDRQQAITLIQSCAEKYGGFVNKYDATDKGLVAIILFGLPRSEGKTLERICDFSLEISECNPDIALGISCGSVYAGYTGTSEIREFTALGAAMNLAARLMSNAKAGEVLTDTFLWREMNPLYDFEFQGSFEAKGITLPVSYYLLSRPAQSSNWQQRRFVGRTEELNSIRSIVEDSLLSRQNTIVYVCGDAGIGKSRLVKEALDAYSPSSYHKFFISCNAIFSKPLEAVKQLIRAYFHSNSQLSEAQGLALFRAQWKALAPDDIEMQRIESHIASLLGYEWAGSVWNSQHPEERPQQLKRAFCNLMEKIALHQPVLIHLDDSQWLDPESKAYFQALSDKQIPQLIIVSPCRYLDNSDKVDLGLSHHTKVYLDLYALSDRESFKLLNTILGMQRMQESTLHLITDRAMGNPLFIEQLASYLLESGKIDPEGRLTGDVGYLSSFSISDIISSRIDRLTDQVRECMFHASVLGMAFNLKVLSQMLNNNLEDELKVGTSNRIWKDLDELRYIFTHILIKDIVYQRMLSDKLRKLHLGAAEAMEVIFADILDEQAEDIALHYEKAGKDRQASAYFDRAGNYFLTKYEYPRAEVNLQKVIAYCENACGAEHEETAAALVSMAHLHMIQGRFDIALAMFLRVLEIEQKIRGTEHPDTATTIHFIATIYNRQAKHDLAEQFLSQALAIREQILGAEHPDTGATLNELANLYVKQGKNDEAKKLFLQVLEIRKKALGIDHYDTTTTINDLGTLHLNLRQCDLAEQLLVQSLEIRERTLGKNHPSTAVSLGNLASVYLLQGRYEESEAIYERALKTHEQLFGKDHPDTVCCLKNFLHLYYVQKLYKVAIIYGHKVVDIVQDSHWAEPVHHIDALFDLANLYIYDNQYEIAEPLYVRVLEMKKQLYGDSHAATASSINALANLYEAMGKYESAEALHLQALALNERLLGAEHNQTAGSLNNLAYLYNRLGKYEQAEPLYIRALRIKEQICGTTHHETARLQHNLATVYYNQSRFEEAEALFLQAFKTREAALGIGNDNTIKTIRSIVDLYKKIGDEHRAAHYQALLPGVV